MSVSLSALDWIILIIASLSAFLLFFVFILIHRTRKQEFNDLWKIRHFLVLFAILSILGNLFTTNLWWAQKGLASISNNTQNYTFVLKPILDMRKFDRINMSEFDPLIADEQEESESSDINDLHSDVESDKSSEQSPKLQIKTKNQIDDVDTDPFSSSEEEDKKKKKEHKRKKEKQEKNKDKHKIPSKKKKATKNLTSDEDIADTGITPKKLKSKKTKKSSNSKKHVKNKKKAIIQDSESESEKSSSSSGKLQIKIKNQVDDDDDDDSDPFADFSD
ncbi:membrane protein ch1 related [Anaeramoeba flamelloides]|uniref:Membrane protein ch1 related n=1 Tax=Anaeramoeba flamelloides TaxID=1746091 RepID=A0AAV7ZQC9_9EUKA|nr:membrane protein ch1 related [Anaeramoeba flamelloides]